MLAPILPTDPELATIHLVTGWKADDEEFFDGHQTVFVTFQIPLPTLRPRRTTDGDNDYEVTVVASDGGKTDTRDVTVTVTDVNEPPAFAGETATRSVAENTDAGQSIGTPVAAEDPDAEATLTYSLGGTNASSFDLDISTGQIQTKEALDKETKETYTVTVSVTDGLNDSGSADAAVDDTITVTITVTDENEPPVIATGRAAINYAENGTDTVETYTATDMDTDTASLTWTVTGTDSASFSITTDGVLKFLNPPNFEAEADADNDNDYQVTVRVSDGPNSDTLDVTVTVTDVNEPPQFPYTENGRRSVPEDMATGENIGSPVAATDPDDGDTLTYSLAGTHASSFDINAATGQLLTKVELDADTQATYSVTVWVRDSKDDSSAGDTADDSSIPVEITVTGVNEPPAISGDASPSHAENDDGVVATYADNDPEDGSIEWTLSGGDAGDFLINATGELTFETTPNFETPADKDQNNIYLITVQASDGTNTDTHAVTVTVTDVNEPPAFAEETDTRSVPENTAAGQPIGSPVAATDPDTRALSDLLPGRDGYVLLRHRHFHGPVADES